MSHWATQAFFYHIYPLGLCAAPARNDFSSPPTPRLNQLYTWLDPIQSLGANALYLGPLFESTAHGYDTADYNLLDRRLGDNSTLANFSREVHRRGMRLILDGVFNHVGRDFWAFRDVRQHGRASAYCDWFHNLRFDGHSAYGDPFTYSGWSGHQSLVKLNLANPAVRDHLFEAIARWVQDYDIDGLRLDAAEDLSPEFVTALSQFCHSLRSDFWLMGEVVFHDYRSLVGPERLDSATNYECYKGLYSSLNDHNYFEIAYALNRQFGNGGIYAGMPLYNFADNHDVDRVASQLNDPALLYPLYLLLFTMPGVPSLYYGSEWGLQGKRTPHSDQALRPALDAWASGRSDRQPDLPDTIRRLSALRHALPALQRGNYRPVFVSAGQLAFERQLDGQTVLVLLNADAQTVCLSLPNLPGEWFDQLNPGERFSALATQPLDVPLYPRWGRVLLRVG